MAHCRRCNRPVDNSKNDSGIRKRSREHVCPMVVIEKHPDHRKGHEESRPMNKAVHESRVEKGGDLYKAVAGKRPEWVVVYRYRTKVEKYANTLKKKGKVPA